MGPNWLTSFEDIEHTSMGFPIPKNYFEAVRITQKISGKKWNEGQKRAAVRATKCTVASQIANMFSAASPNYDRPAVVLGMFWHPKFIDGTFQVHNLFPSMSSAQEFAYSTIVGLKALEQLANHDWTVSAVSKRPYRLPDAIQNILVNDEGLWVKAALGNRIDLTPSLLLKLSEDKEPFVRYAIAARNDLSLKVQESLLADEDHDVLVKLSQNESVPENI